MHVFVTGAAGFIGAALIKELHDHGHTVLGLARSEKSADIITALGGQVLRGDLKDLPTLTKGAASSDAVVHLAFDHNFEDFPAACAVDRAAIQALAEGLTGSGKPLVIAAAGLAGTMGTLSDEETPLSRDHPPWSERAPSSDLLFQLATDRDFRGSTVRLPPSVHGKNDPNFVTQIAELVQKSGFVPLLQTTGRWPAAHLNDVASLFRLVLEKGRNQGTYNASTEVGVKTNDMLALLAKKLGLPLEGNASPERLKEGLSFFSMATALDIPTSSEKTQKELGWKPVGPTMLEDIEVNYF